MLETRVVPLLVALTVLPTPLVAQPPSGPTDFECHENEKTVVQSTIRGGYGFDHQSARSRASGRSACRVYRMRNKSGGETTPVIWKDPTSFREIYIDTNLARCSKNSECPWIEVTKESYESGERQTLIGFGINKDQFEDKPAGFREFPQDQAMRKTNQRYVRVAGTIADREGEPLEFSVFVASTLLPAAGIAKSSRGKYLARYDLYATSPTVQISLPPAKPSPKEPLVLEWTSPESQEFSKALMSKGEPQATDGASIVILSVDSPLTLNRSGILRLVQYGDVIFETTAPAYRAQD